MQLFSDINAIVFMLAQNSESMLDSIVSLLTANPVLGYLILVAVASLAAFLIYGWDKRQAKTNDWRISEKRLHALALLGGWPGTLLGQSYFRHKTQKNEFKIMTWLAAAMHVGLVVWYVYPRIAG